MIEKFVTVRRAEMYTVNGYKTGKFIPASTVLDCDFEWGTAPLTGKRRVVSEGAYKGYYVLSVDLRVYISQPEEPEQLPVPDEVQFRWKDANGNIAVTKEYVPK